MFANKTHLKPLSVRNQPDNPCAVDTMRLVYTDGDVKGRINVYSCKFTVFVMSLNDLRSNLLFLIVAYYS